MNDTVFVFLNQQQGYPYFFSKTTNQHYNCKTKFLAGWHVKVLIQRRFCQCLYGGESGLAGWLSTVRSSYQKEIKKSFPIFSQWSNSLPATWYLMWCYTCYTEMQFSNEKEYLREWRIQIAANRVSKHCVCTPGQMQPTGTFYHLQL